MDSLAVPNSGPWGNFFFAFLPEAVYHLQHCWNCSSGIFSWAYILQHREGVAGTPWIWRTYITFMFNSNIHLKSWTKTLRSGFELWPIGVRVAFSSIINSALWWKTLEAWGLLLFKDLLNAQRYIQNQLSNFTLSAFQNSHAFYFCFRSFNQNNDGLSNRDSNEFISHSEKKHAHNAGLRTKVLLESCETIYLWWIIPFNEQM